MIMTILNTALDFLQANFQVLTILLAVLAAFYTVKQINEAKKARVLPAFLEFEKRIVNEQARKDRRFIYENKLDPFKDRAVIERVSTTFDLLGVLLREDLVYAPLIFHPFSDVIIKCWLKLHKLILLERNRKGEFYMEGFEYLNEAAKKFRKKHKLPEVLEKDIHSPIKRHLKPSLKRQ